MTENIRLLQDIILSGHEGGPDSRIDENSARRRPIGRAARTGELR
ncbi:hypothetical protein [Rhizorhabdus wittichii]|jgi:hypothetical protein|nr:hypothetical protein [Rhizorhabdus wittichii]